MNAKDYSLIIFVFLLIVIAFALMLSTGLACSNLIGSWSCKKNGIGFIGSVVVLLIIGGFAFSDLMKNTCNHK